MSRDNFKSRRSANRQKKRRKQNILLSLLVTALIILVIVFAINLKDNNVSKSDDNDNLSQIVNGNSNNEKAQQENNNENDKENQSDNNSLQDNTKDENKEEKEKEVKITEIETENDNVEKAYIGNWKPVGTEQTGEHTTDFKDGSADRKEIRQAILEVTDIREDELIEHWVGNNGPDKVVATVSDFSHENIFRVYLSWVNKKGWQVNKVERLKEYDQNNSDSVQASDDKVTKIEKDSE